MLLHTNLADYNFPNDDIIIEFYPDKAPITVDNFLLYAKEGHYNELFFHRVIQNFMIQAGKWHYSQEKGYWEVQKKAPIINESYNGLSNLRGTIAMARTPDPNSASAEFFINQVDNLFLDKANAADGYGYCVFGQVLSGIDVVDNIAAVPTYQNDVNYPDDSPQFIVMVETTTILPCDISYCVDYDNSGVVDLADYARVAGNWMADDCNSFNLFCSSADLDFDGSVNHNDLTILAENWLEIAGTDAELSDYDRSGAVDEIDLLMIIDNWLNDTCDADNNYCSGTDLNRDGIVDFLDLSYFAGNWRMQI